MNNNLKAGIILFGTLILSRLLPLPANSEPLLGLAVLTPYISKSNLAFLFPLGYIPKGFPFLYIGRDCA